MAIYGSRVNMDDEVTIRTLEAIRYSPFKDVDAGRQLVTVELPRQQKTYEDFIKRGWRDITDEQGN